MTEWRGRIYGMCTLQLYVHSLVREKLQLCTIGFFKIENGLVKVELQGSCSGCPSSVMTLKQGVQNLLCHYVPEVKKVEAE